MGPLIPRLALRGDGATLHPFWIQRALGRVLGRDGRATPAPTSALISPSPEFDTIAQRIELFWPIIDAWGVAYQLRQSLVQAVIHQESGGDANAYRIEPKLADISVGLMQVLMGTARGLGFKGTLLELFTPLPNIHLGVSYLSELRARFDTEELALIAYNAGPAAAVLRKTTGWSGRGVGYARSVLALAELYTAWNRERRRY